jgi:hypothetical protein
VSIKHVLPALLMLSVIGLSGCAAYDPAVRMGKKGAIGVDYHTLQLDMRRLMEMGRPVPRPWGYR